MIKILTLFSICLVCFSQSNKDKRIFYYGGIAALYGVAEILPEHPPWLSSDTVKQQFSPSESVPSFMPVVTGVGLMLLATNPFRENYTSRMDGGNNLLGLIEAMAFEHGVTQIVKNLVRRERPNNLKAPVSFWSGHASVSFTIAHYTNLYIHDYSNFSSDQKTLTAISLYSLASYVAWTRVDELQHHWSDVLMGSLWGIVASHFIYDIRNNGKFDLFESQKDNTNHVQIFSLTYRF